MSKYTLHPKKHYASPRWSTEILDCGVPMSFDQYNKCGYGCVYCFSQFQKAVSAKDTYFEDTILPVSLKGFKRLFTEGKRTNQFWPYIQDRRVMQWGGLADPFCSFERKFGVGLKLLRFLKKLNYPITFSTKGVWWTKDPRYVELFKGQENWNVKMSIITLDETKRKAIEKRCPSSKARLRAMERIASWGCGGVTLRLRPFIIGMSNPSHTRLIQDAGDAGADALSTEFFCLEVRSNLLRENLAYLSRILGYDIFAFYREYSCGAGYLRLNRNVKRRFVDEMEEACAQAEMRFYISDAHFKERCANGCCCGLAPSMNYSRGQLGRALMIAKRKRRVKWKSIGKHLDYAKGFLFRHAQGFNTVGSIYRAKFWDFTMYDWIKWQWNHPTGGKSPYKMFEGILAPDGLDKAGNIIYRYNAERE